MLQHQVKLEPALPPVSGPKPRGRRKKICTKPIRPVCPQCEKQFSNQSALTKHKLTHSDERKFACQQCSKAFKRHDHLTGHMQTHSNRKPFNCTLPGCDKTYCDARSLRRHKENIHHIVTPRENNSTNNHNNSNHHESYDHINGSNISIHLDTKTEQNCNKSNGFAMDDNNNNINATDLNNNSISSTTTNPNGAHIISHHSTSHADMILSPTTTYQTSTMSNTATSTDSLIEGQSVCMTHTSDAQQQQQQQQHQQPSLPPLTQNQHLQPSHLLRRRIQRLHSDQGAYGCNTHNQDLLSGRGYLACSTTTNPHTVPTQPHHNGNNNHHDHYLSNQHASYSADYATSQHFSFDFNNNLNHHHMDHAISSSTLPLSADSVTDSGLGLNVHYERRTSPNHQQQQHQPQQQQQQQQQSSYQRYPHPQNDTCYSAGYAATQHFDFDNQHASFSADYASTQQFNFDFSNMNNQHMDHAISSSTVPLSADSVTDSGLALNVNYERQTPNHQLQQPQPPPPLPPTQTQPQQPQHQEQPLYQRYQHAHQPVSYSAGYASTQHFDFV